MRIEPYLNNEVQQVLNELVKNEELTKFLDTFLSATNSKFLSLPGSTFLAKQIFKSKIKDIHTIEDFQDQIALVLDSVINKTISKFTFSGLDSLNPDEGYLFIGNHRDITLDSALCNYALRSVGFPTTYNAIGDNLVSINWMGDLLRLNKSFVITRSGNNKKQIYLNLLKASNFIRKKIKANNLIWIAQQQGRSKDGSDVTDPTVLKMIHLSMRKEIKFDNLTSEINIVPCSISYQYDPLIKEKATKAIKGNKKESHEDVEHIFKGIMQNKGNVHLEICKPLKGSYSPDNLAREIDISIKNAYKLWDTNEYAHKFLSNDGDLENANLSTAKKYFDNFLSEMTNDEVEYIMKFYANPYKKKLHE